MELCREVLGYETPGVVQACKVSAQEGRQEAQEVSEIILGYTASLRYACDSVRPCHKSRVRMNMKERREGERGRGRKRGRERKQAHTRETQRQIRQTTDTQTD